MTVNSPVLEPGQRAAMIFHRVAGKEEMQRINRLLPLLKALLGDAAAGEVVNSLVVKGIKQIAEMSLEELKAEGLPDDKALTLYAAIELGRQWQEEVKSITPKKIAGPDDLYNLLAHTSNYDREVLSVVMLDTKLQVIDIYQASIGTLAAAPATPREILKEAVKRSASSVVLSHNHPSGDPSPSQADIDFTDTIVQAGNLLGIPILDHVVIGKGKWTSLMDWNENLQPPASKQPSMQNNPVNRAVPPMSGNPIQHSGLEHDLAMRLLGK